MQNKEFSKETIKQRLAGLFANKDREIDTDQNASFPDLQLKYLKAAAVLDYFSFETIKPIGYVGYKWDENLTDKKNEKNEEKQKREDREQALKNLYEFTTAVQDENKRLQSALKDEVRRKYLKLLKEENGFQEALYANPERPQSPLQKLFEAYLNGNAPLLKEQSHDQLICTSQISAWAHGIIEGVPSLEEVRRRIAVESLISPFKFLLGITKDNPKGSFYGRMDAINKLKDYVEFHEASSTTQSVVRAVRRVFSLYEKPPLMIYAPGGTGKSSLLAKFILDHAHFEVENKIPFIYLDFDRSSLSIEEPVTLLLEAIEQLSVQYPETTEQFRELRLKWHDRLNENRRKDQELERHEGISEDMPERFSLKNELSYLTEFAEFVNPLLADNQPFLIVLDTFEEVQWRSSVYVGKIFEFLDSLQNQVPTLRIVIAGRAPVQKIQKIDIALYELKNFDPEAAEKFLQKRGVKDPEVAREIAVKVGGSPLTLKLAAELYKKEGTSHKGLKELKTSDWFRRLEEAAIQAQLYSRILGHVHDENVRKLAHPGLVLRRITPQLILDVLAHPCDVKVKDIQDAEDLFGKLRQEVALVNQSSNEVLEHRPELRKVMLDLLKRDPEKKQVVEEIHQNAIKFYFKSEDVISRTEEIYHRLSLSVEREILEKRWLPGIRFDYELIQELPLDAQSYLSAKLGLEVNSEILSNSDWEDWKLHAERRAKEFLDVNKPQEALDILRQRENKDDGTLKILEIRALQRLQLLDEALKVAELSINSALENHDSSALELALLSAQISERIQSLPELTFIIQRFKRLIEHFRDDNRVLTLGLKYLNHYYTNQEVNNLKILLITVINSLSPNSLAKNSDVVKETVTTLFDIGNKTEKYNLVAVNPRHVFVIYGKNVKAKEQLFKFLRALNLKPVDYNFSLINFDQKNNPEINNFKNAVRSAQCVIALLTEAEMLELINQNNLNQLTEKKTANIFLELGIAFGLLAKQQVIIINIESAKRNSLNKNIKYLFLNNETSSRENLVESLKFAGCVVDTDSLDYLSTEKGGNFANEYILEKSEIHKLDRGRFTEVIADSAISYRLKNIDLDNEFRADLKVGKAIDLKHHYMGVMCARNWLNLTDNYDYGHSKLTEVISRSFADVIQASRFGERAVDLISLGSGDGELDVILLRRLLTVAESNLQYYYCIDISFELLQQAVTRIVRQLESNIFSKNFFIKAIHGDFMELNLLSPIYTYDDSINFFTLNGFTFGNYNEIELLKNIRNGMEVGDLLFFDARLHTLKNWNGDSNTLTAVQKEEILQSYNNDLNNRFAFGPVEFATNISYKEVEFGYDIHNMVTSVPKALNIVTYCENIMTKFRNADDFLFSEKLNLASTTAYSYSLLAEWVQQRGFELVWSKAEANIGLFLIRKI